MPTFQLRNPAWPRPLIAGVLGVLIAWYFVSLVPHISPYAGGADSSGYLTSARLMSQGRLFAQPRTLAGHSADEFGSYSFVPVGLIPRPGGRLAPTYPTGYPLQLLVASVFGWGRAATVVNVFTVLASAVVLFAYGRRLGLSPGLALGGVGLLWLCPLSLYATILPMSDLPALCWSLATLYCALRAREDWKWGLLGGAAAGMAVLVRPTNVLLVVPVLVALGWRPKSWLAFGLGGLPAAIFFFLYNWQAYGSPVVTGYGNFWWEYGPQYFGHNLRHFAYWIPCLLSPLVVLAVGAPFFPAGRQRGLTALLVWFAMLTCFYAFYFHSGETWWYLRFILPAFPALIAATLVVLQAARRSVRSLPWLATGGLAALLLLAAGWELRQIRQLDVLHIEDGERSYPDAAHWAQQHLPANSAIFCMQVSGTLYYYTDFLILRYDQILTEKFGSLLAAVAQQDRPVYAALFAFETAEAQARVGGQWTRLATVGQVTFWQRQP